MKILLSGLCLGLLLLIVPIYINYRFRLNVGNKMLVIFGRGIVAAGLLGALLYGGVALNSIVYDIVVALLFCLSATLLTLRKANLKMCRLFLPLLGGNVIAVAAVSIYALLIVVSADKTFVSQLFLPLSGLLAGGIMVSNAKALEFFFVGLRHHGQLYYYILGNGGSHQKAVNYFVRRSLKAAVVSLLKRLSLLFFVTSPVVLFALVMAGCDVVTAAALQILLVVMELTASLLSIGFTLIVGRKYCFDEYERLRENRSAAITSAPASATSTSPSSRSYTDSESQQPQE